jgi:soluble P-type ATPase
MRIAKIGLSHYTGMRAASWCTENAETDFSIDAWGPYSRFEVNMIAIDIPGWGSLAIENLVFDLNGTLAKDGKILPGVKEKINSLSAKVKIYILTADTQGTASKEIPGMNGELVKVSERNSREVKLRFLQSLDPMKTAAIGNGNNDHLILREAFLGIAVMGEEGLSIGTMKDADVIVKNIIDALDMFLKPKRLIATLRK